MDGSPGERIELRKRIATTLGERDWGDIDLILDEFGFQLIDPEGWSPGPYVLAVTKGEAAERLIQLDEWLHPSSVSMPDPGDPTENTPFTEDEQLEIARRLVEIKTHMETAHDLSSDQMRSLEGRLNYLQEAAGRMGRVDWRNAAAGVFLGTIMNAMLPGEVARDALVTLLQTVGHMFGHPMLELPSGL